MAATNRRLRALVGSAAVLLVASGVILAQDVLAPLDLAAICKQVKCRPAGVVHLILDNENYYEVEVVESPIVYENVVTVMPGETLRLQASVGENGLLDLKAIDDVTEATPSVTLTFGQNPTQGDIPPMMILRVSHSFSKVLKYRAALVPANAAVPYPTTVCPVHPAIKNYEQWPHPIRQLILIEMRLIDEDAESATVCE